MKPSERDDLLIRLDEQSHNTWNALKEKDDSIDKKLDRVIEHMGKQNGRIGKLEIGLASLISILTGLGILDATVFHRVIGG